MQAGSTRGGLGASGARDLTPLENIAAPRSVAPVAPRIAVPGDADVFVPPTPAPTTAARTRPILLYNDQCETCQVLSAWVKKRDLSGGDLIDERPIGHDPAVLAALDPRLDMWDVYEKIHVLMPNGDIKKGGAAIGEVLRRLPGTKWMGPLLDIEIGGTRPFEKVVDAGYTTLDALRPALGCSSCGGGPVKWWAKPVKWIADGIKAIHRLFTGAPAPEPHKPELPPGPPAQ